MLFLLPLLAVGILALAGRYSAPPSVHAPAPAVAGVPSPFVVLDGFVRAGRVPPPFVVQCAIAEAELAGRMDIVTELVRLFVEPTVRAAQEQNAVRSMAFGIKNVLDQPVADVIERAKREGAEPSRVVAEQINRAIVDALPGMPSDPRAWTNDEEMVQAALDAMAHPELGTQIIPSDAPPPPTVESPAVAISGAIPHAQTAHFVSPFRHAESVFTPQQSPITNLPREKFGQFAEALARESASFEGPRHVGQFRARKDRLVELGIDPADLRGDPDAQIDALCVDMADAFEHARASGMLRQHCRRAIDLGVKHGGVHTITASGILGVIQAAGLEGAADWLDNPADRDRFPHTTGVFVRTNGVF